MPASPPPPVDDRARQLDRVLLAAFLENIPDQVCFKDRDGRFIAVSRSLVRHFGLRSAADLIGRTAADFWPEDRARAIRADEERIWCTGQPLLGRHERDVRPDGTVYWFLTHTLPLRAPGGAIIGTFTLRKDVTQTKDMEQALERARQELVDASRHAGMAEVANGVLHNVGNVLNSLNVSASVITSGLRQAKAESLARCGELLREHRADLAAFVTEDPKGRRIPELIRTLARHAVTERHRLLQEVTVLQKNIDHIKEVVAMQQTYATTVGVVEPLDPAALMEDALQMNADALARHGISVERDFQSAPTLIGEKAKILQILVNLIRNAQHACTDSRTDAKRIILRMEASPALDRIRLTVEDNGIGIPPENLTRIFGHGFTTRANGHGFGLHSAANAAREMKGTLTVQSRGPGHGAAFTLDLPLAAAR
jgi:PAS domain S-box-containing protein